MLKILPVLLTAATLTLAGDAVVTVVTPPATPSPALATPITPTPVHLPGFHPAIGRYELHITGSNGSLVDLTATGPVDLEKLKLFEAEVRKEVERTISFDLRWEESVTPADGGGVTLLRVMRSAKVDRLINGKLEAGPLPIDYQDAVLEIGLGADGRMTRRKFTAPRLVEAEKEILEQFLEVEPFPALPETMTPGERVERVSRQMIPSESRDVPPTPQVTIDRYQLSGAADISAEKLSPPAGGAALRMDRDSLIEGAGGTLNPIRTLGRFWLVLNAAGLVNECHGSYEQSYTEILPAPPELLLAPLDSSPASAPASAPVSHPSAAATNAKPAPAGATPGVRVTPLPEGKVQWAYRLPGQFTLSRKTLSVPVAAAPPVSVPAPVPEPVPASAPDTASAPAPVAAPAPSVERGSAPASRHAALPRSRRTPAKSRAAVKARRSP